MKVVQWKHHSKIGPLYLVASEKALLGLLWKEQKIVFASDLTIESPEIRILAQTSKQLDEYFSGERIDFDIPLEVNGTKFQRQVWNQLSKIPYGKTSFYQEIAKKIKNDRAYRAVGTANGKNPISIIVPCHRVITADGSLGGYAGGLGAKSKLLKIEGSIS